MKKFIRILALLCIASPLVTRAQDSLYVELQADVVNQNIWRGTNLGCDQGHPYHGFLLAARFREAYCQPL